MGQSAIGGAAIQHRAAGLEGGNADARPRPAAEPAGDLEWRQVETFGGGESGATASASWVPEPRPAWEGMTRSIRRR
ncbi:hypothetical protein AUC69_12995 [Methyloceanibacter superfactus]|uniref:Uncharacterized protein n=1 Tax=Methyloceanibacter superfactus TaxID=1774969 RepID=A0A1E3VU26_9HYPH|nr:hypothetical protein AUC69_12995 [Methyloceanibacter superfactus]